MAQQWPSTLPQCFESQSFGETTVKRYIETELDVGPQKRRARFTRDLDELRGSMMMTQSQYLTFKSFYQNTLIGGVKSFYFDHPITGDQQEFTFQGAPQFSAVGPVNFRLSFTWRQI